MNAFIAFLRRQFLRSENPRWQGHVVRPLMRRLSRSRPLSFDMMLHLEWLLRSLLGQPLSLRSWNRMTFNDKVTYRRLRVRDSLFAVFSDRLATRTFVEDRLGTNCLPELLLTASQSTAFADCDGPFVLKANHGSQMVTLVESRRKLSPEELAQADEWLSKDYAWEDFEWGYLSARRILVAEEFLTGADGGVPPDFKMFVFDAKVAAIEKHSGRFTNGHLIDVRLPDWSPFTPRTDADESPAPENLDLMLEWAALLGRGLDFVRVDAYDLGDRVVIGELTAYPGGGNSVYEPAIIDISLGRAWRTRPRRSAAGHTQGTQL